MRSRQYHEEDRLPSDDQRPQWTENRNNSPLNIGTVTDSTYKNNTCPRQEKTVNVDRDSRENSNAFVTLTEEANNPGY